MGESALPAAPLTVAQFLSDLAPEWRPATPADPANAIVDGHVRLRSGLRPASIAGYLAAISVAHRDAGIDDAHNPSRHAAVRRVMAGIRRHPTVTPPRRRAALRVDEMATILATLSPDDRLADARDAALLLVGWKAALRTDDLHRLDLTDLVVEDEGLTVHLRRSKTDQAATGTAIGIITTGPDDPLDAVTAWTRWRNRLAGHVIHAGPAWRAIDRHGTRPRTGRLSAHSINTIIAHRATTAGLDGDYGGHSLRRGFATSALAAGATERAVQRHGRWASPTSMAAYIDEAERFADTNPSRYLRLDPHT
jgi:integrase